MPSVEEKASSIYLLGEETDCDGSSSGSDNGMHLDVPHNANQSEDDDYDSDDDIPLARLREKAIACDKDDAPVPAIPERPLPVAKADLTSNYDSDQDSEDDVPLAHLRKVPTHKLATHYGHQGHSEYDADDDMPLSVFTKAPGLTDTAMQSSTVHGTASADKGVDVPSTVYDVGSSPQFGDCDGDNPLDMSPSSSLSETDMGVPQQGTCVNSSLPTASSTVATGIERASSLNPSAFPISNSSLRPSQVRRACPPRKITWEKHLQTLHIEEFVGPVGPIDHLGSDSTEMDFLNLMFPEELYTCIANETNRYAAQRQAAAGKVDTRWSPVCPGDIRTFLGVRIYMSIVHVPELRQYWETHHVYGRFPIAEYMTRDRFEKIQQYFHCNDNSLSLPQGSVGHDKLHHVRPILDAVLHACRTRYNVHREVAVDEAMVGFRGRLTFRQFMPGKPERYGIKVLVLADSTNGYVCEFQVYTGKMEQNTEVGLAHRVVVDLTRGLIGKKHHIYFDNFFTSVPLAQQLLKDDLYCCGTMRTNRSGWPLTFNRQAIGKAARGYYKQLQSGPLLATEWKDSKPVFLLSTNCNPTLPVSSTYRRKRDGRKTSVPCPPVVNMYNSYMNGVDRADQLRTQYPSARKARKWWLYLFWFLWDVAIVNAFIIFRESIRHQQLSRSGRIIPATQLQFRRNLGLHLLASYTKRKRCTEITVPEAVSRFEHGSHFPVKWHKSRCKNCASKGKRAEPSWGCPTCKVNLCVECFGEYHGHKFLP